LFEESFDVRHLSGVKGRRMSEFFNAAEEAIVHTAVLVLLIIHLVKLVNSSLK
jgi:hypothetical protein